MPSASSTSAPQVLRRTPADALQRGCSRFRTRLRPPPPNSALPYGFRMRRLREPRQPSGLWPGAEAMVFRCSFAEMERGPLAERGRSTDEDLRPDGTGTDGAFVRRAVSCVSYPSRCRQLLRRRRRAAASSSAAMPKYANDSGWKLHESRWSNGRPRASGPFVNGGRPFPAPRRMPPALTELVQRLLDVTTSELRIDEAVQNTEPHVPRCWPNGTRALLQTSESACGPIRRRAPGQRRSGFRAQPNALASGSEHLEGFQQRSHASHPPKHLPPRLTCGAETRARVERRAV